MIHPSLLRYWCVLRLNLFITSLASPTLFSSPGKGFVSSFLDGGIWVKFDAFNIVVPYRDVLELKQTHPELGR